MTKRERIEDLGRLYVMIDNLTNHDVFDFYQGRSKDIHDYWETLSDEQKDDFLHKITYGIRDISEKLSEIWCVARGNDDEDQA